MNSPNNVWSEGSFRHYQDKHDCFMNQLFEERSVCLIHLYLIRNDIYVFVSVFHPELNRSIRICMMHKNCNINAYN